MNIFIYLLCVTSYSWPWLATSYLSEKNLWVVCKTSQNNNERMVLNDCNSSMSMSRMTIDSTCLACIFAHYRWLVDLFEYFFLKNGSRLRWKSKGFKCLWLTHELLGNELSLYTIRASFIQSIFFFVCSHLIRK